jgi:hypothetical protein
LHVQAPGAEAHAFGSSSILAYQWSMSSMIVAASASAKVAGRLVITGSRGSRLPLAFFTAAPVVPENPIRRGFAR